ncbi:hypothetical protein MMYC01_210593 [Madurella mycetomatis]|uniref:Uncharacterized protein n=1 Tax=Madurella mycetomatis TaxID=100816 RepID=A0A175VNA9_9PEZI|nr:hypothetical protein MMYC01_210593 [Madurella mycetomatis]
MEDTGTPEAPVRSFEASDGGPANPSTDAPLQSPTAEDRGLLEACRTGCIAAIDAALRRGTSISVVPIASVVSKRKPIAVVGGRTSNGGRGEDRDASRAGGGLGNAVIVKALTLQLAARARQVEAFSHLVSIGARLDEPGTSVASIRSLVRLVTRGPDAPALLRLFCRANLARQLDQEMRNEALLWLLQGCTSPRSSPALTVDERVEFARALLDAGASPNFVRGSAYRYISTLSAAVFTLSPDLVRLLLDHGACPDGPPDLQPQPITDMLLDRGADINVCVPYLRPITHAYIIISFTNPLVVFLDAVDCWDGGGGGPQALDALWFLLDRGSSPDRPPIHPAQENRRAKLTRRELWHTGHHMLGPARLDPITDLLDKWGLGKLATPAFTSALEMLVGHPSHRGGVRAVAEVFAKYDYTRPPSSSSSPSYSPDTTDTEQKQDTILDAWRRIVSSTARLLAADELGEFFHAYIVCKVTCPSRSPPSGPLEDQRFHGPEVHKIGDLATTTVAALLATGADANHRHHKTSLRNDGQGDGPTALHSICLWLVGRDPKEKNLLFGWKPRCSGFRHTPDRVQFIQFLVEACGADAGARYQGRTPAEILVQLRQPELDAEETTSVWGRDIEVVREARQALVGWLENAAKTS